jgi:DNA-binding transcriptional LysR family regulator
MADMDPSQLNDLELRHLEALSAVATEGTFGRAADALGYTQSAVSQQIAGLERIVNAKVFDRPGGPRPVQLTPVGRMLLSHADEVLGRVSSLARDLAEFKAGVTGRIDVGVFQSVAVKVVPMVVGRLRQEAPRVDVRPIEGINDQHLIEMVSSRELDLAFGVGSILDPRLKVVHLSHDPFVAVVPVDHPGGDTVSLTGLGVVSMIGQPIHDTCQMKVDAGLADAGITPDYVFRTADNAAVQSMVRAGMGIAIMPLLAVDANDPAIRICRLEPPIPHRELSLVIGPDPSPVTQHFVDIAIEVCREVVATAPV